MKAKRWQSITDHGVLSMLQEGRYQVCPDTGQVTNKTGKRIKPFTSLQKGAQHQFVYLFRNGNERRGIAVHRLVWMSVVDDVIPTGWDIHHIDEDPTNNSFTNLLCVHPSDHHKLHQQQPDIPF